MDNPEFQIYSFKGYLQLSDTYIQLLLRPLKYYSTEFKTDLDTSFPNSSIKTYEA